VDDERRAYRYRLKAGKIFQLIRRPTFWRAGGPRRPIQAAWMGKDPFQLAEALFLVQECQTSTRTSARPFGDNAPARRCWRRFVQTHAVTLSAVGLGVDPDVRSHIKWSACIMTIFPEILLFRLAAAGAVPAAGLAACISKGAGL